MRPGRGRLSAHHLALGFNALYLPHCGQCHRLRVYFLYLFTWPASGPGQRLRLSTRACFGVRLSIYHVASFLALWVLHGLGLVDTGCALLPLSGRAETVLELTHGTPSSRGTPGCSWLRLCPLLALLPLAFQRLL